MTSGAGVCNTMECLLESIFTAGPACGSILLNKKVGVQRYDFPEVMDSKLAAGEHNLSSVLRGSLQPIQQKELSQL